MSAEQHMKVAYAFANSLWDKAAILSMLRGAIPYDKEFCDKFYKDRNAAKTETPLNHQEYNLTPT